MASQNESLRFDHRELAVIFSLFTFVSLLMFTVGILVGKGLAQAKYETALLKTGRPGAAPQAPVAAEEPHAAPDPHAASAAPAHEAKHDDHGKPAAAETHGAAAHAEPQEKIIAATDDEDEGDSAPKHADELKLVPKTEKGTEALASDLPGALKLEDTEHVLKNPKVRQLVEDSPSDPKEAFASLAPLPPRKLGVMGRASGKFTVQVGSYLSQRDAADRVEQLKKLGYPYAYFSAKELGEQKETWFRVWLGYFPDMESANQSGKQLQSRGEVRNYLVRKSDASH